MIFIGQKKIIKELFILQEQITNGKNYNLAFFAPAGYGKTVLAFWLIHKWGLNNTDLNIPERKGEIELNLDKRFIFVDEVHLVENPEIMYYPMESGKHTFIIATNNSQLLPDALVSRCIPFYFSPYSDTEIFQIVKQYLNMFHLPEVYYSTISSRVKTPRQIKLLCQRVEAVFRVDGIPSDSEKLDEILTTLLDVDAEGLTSQDYMYLDFLSRVGRASISSISGATRLSRDLILSEIEPRLLYLGKIKITSRGREVC